MALVRWQPRTTKEWDPLRGFDAMTRDLNRLFGWNLGRQARDLENGTWLPPMDILGDEETYVVRMDLPGLSKDDVQISMENGVLTVSGERKHEVEKKDDCYHCAERAYGKFERSVTLPSDVDTDKTEATFKNGVLEIRLPKTEQAKSRKIAIKS
ncbi:MAG: Hsp20 family protein [Candidatus Eisenbacteria bacterium]|nr:Hsp20 family protein [Candidatus Eisenbacteria bacterium]